MNVGSVDSMSELVSGAQELVAKEKDSSKVSSDRVVSHQDITLDIDYRVSPTLKLVVFTR